MAVLSDRTIREQLKAGRIVLEPLDESCIQPASVDVHLDRFFRVFLNHTMAVIDVKQDLSRLTEPVEVDEDGVFILHPGEFVLGSTLERIGMPDDLVARVEGKSSLGRLGLLIHSSLPASETVLFLDDDGLQPRPIGELVTKQRAGFVVSFDPDTFEVGFAEVTGWYEGPPDRIFEVELASGRRVRVTAGHNLFTLDRAGSIRKVRTGELGAGVRVALPARIPDPRATPHVIDVTALIPEADLGRFVIDGPTVRDAIDADVAFVAEVVRSVGVASPAHFVRAGRLPLAAARQLPALVQCLTVDDRVGVRGGRNPVPARIEVDTEVAWLLGLYVAEGHRRPSQFTVCNTDQAILDRAAATLDRLGMTYHRSREQVVCGSSVGSELLGWLGTGGKAPTKRVPPMVFGWPQHLIEAFVAGVVDGDGSLDGGRTSVWTTSAGLVADLLVLFQRLGRRAGSCARPARGNAMPSWQVYAPDNEHKLLTSVPLPDELLVAARRAVGLNQTAAATAAGYRHASDLNNIERRSGRDAVRRSTLARLRDAYVAAGLAAVERAALDRLVDGDLCWDEVVAVHDTGATEPVYDLEVRPSGRKIENFVAGSGVLVSNTAGFIDAGFDGHITLELSNVANLPITLYPGMKIGQISFLEMTTPADVPYGSGALGSKYQGQRGPTPSRYWENFDR